MPGPVIGVTIRASTDDPAALLVERPAAIPAARVAAQNGADSCQTPQLPSATPTTVKGGMKCGFR